MYRTLNLIDKLGYTDADSSLDINTSKLVANRLNEGHLVTVDGAKPLHFQPVQRQGWLDKFVILVKDDEDNELGVLPEQCIHQLLEGVYSLYSLEDPRWIHVVAHDTNGREALLKYADPPRLDFTDDKKTTYIPAPETMMKLCK